MIKKSLISKLYSYNIHLGSISPYNSNLNYYLIGNRFNFNIINLNKSFILLKKALFLVKRLSMVNGSLLFYYSNYLNLNIVHKCVLLSICKNTQQQIITYNWVYGSVGNFFFSFHSLVRDLTYMWMKRHSYLFNLDKKWSQYYSFEFENEKFEFFEYFFLTKWKLKRYSFQKNNFKLYSKWYKKWLRTTNTYKFWTFKTSSYKHTNFIKKLCLNDINNIWKKKKILNFKYLFVKLYYYIYSKKKDPYSYDINIKKNAKIEYEYLYNKFQSYWRFLLYFKYFNNYYQIPDGIFSIHPNKDLYPVKEFNSSSLISIGLVDTDSDSHDLHYPIISNDDSIILVIFYFTLFSNLFLEDKVNLYSLSY